MLRRHKKASAVLAAAGTLLGMLALGPASAAVAAPTWRTHVCHGTPRHPGELIGVNLNVIVRGLCLVQRGPVAVSGSVIVTRGSALIAAFARHNTHMSVAGNIVVHKGGALILGCNPKSFPCLDDNQKHPTLTSRNRVGGSIIGLAALGMVVHSNWIGHSVAQSGGGGGLTCKPQGVFAAHHSPAYSAYEDNWIGGGVFIKGLRTCWLGVIRNWTGDSVHIVKNKAADPDAMEIVSNTVHGNLICWRNSPKVQFGDSRGTPNRVGRRALLECSFHRILPNPSNQHQHFSHISVHL
ncbi:MAG TPA: hypothetical protein VF843_17630 [Streptosporangiaceae bacterium]